MLGGRSNLDGTQCRHAVGSGRRAGAIGTGADRSTRAAWARGRSAALYAERLDTVEVNGTFYRLIEVETFGRWREATPRASSSPARASRYITHMKRLKEPERAVGRWLRAGRGAGGQARADRVPAAGPLQTRSRTSRELPGGAAGRSSLRIRVPRSGMVPARDPGGARHAQCRALPLRVRGPGAARGHRRLRLHPPARPWGPYQGSYSDAALRTWAKRIRAWTKAGRDVYCYFDNDDSGYAPRNALRLRSMLA